MLSLSSHLFGELMRDRPARIQVLPHPNTSFDEGQFLRLLRGTSRLKTEEKAALLLLVPSLTQRQMDEIIEHFEEERRELKVVAEAYFRFLAAERQALREWITVEEAILR